MRSIPGGFSRDLIRQEAEVRASRGGRRIRHLLAARMGGVHDLRRRPQCAMSLRGGK